MHAVEKQQMISMKSFEWWKWVQYGLSNMYVNVICSLIKNSDPWMHIHIYPLVISIKKLKKLWAIPIKVIDLPRMEIVLWEINVPQCYVVDVSMILQAQAACCRDLYNAHIFIWDSQYRVFRRRVLSSLQHPNFHNDPNTPALNFLM